VRGEYTHADAGEHFDANGDPDEHSYRHAHAHAHVNDDADADQHAHLHTHGDQHWHAARDVGDSHADIDRYRGGGYGHPNGYANFNFDLNSSPTGPAFKSTRRRRWRWWWRRRRRRGEPIYPGSYANLDAN
jgi:hypothetical protein